MALRTMADEEMWLCSDLTLICADSCQQLCSPPFMFLGHKGRYCKICYMYSLIWGYFQKYSGFIFCYLTYCVCVC